MVKDKAQSWGFVKAVTSFYGFRKTLNILYILMGSDNGVQHSELLSFWTLSIDKVKKTW
jgi:hypothetical protein